ncbi:MAG: Lipoprotein [candidate division WS6 bacterium GW2011_GWF2_39_15]|uniref:Lipoprotein n=1 Tax=candidate division WS6 bacterium GW2011_GWF2_39_15 TaxID=1619100 RepID=A0A0G0MQW1_9BACT|nr:MAG: Lipoprotein [candidate division WS6 bacterium GW2011_GWF2_39_15]
MKRNDDESLKSITSISFRNLAHTLEVEGSNLYQDTDVFTDDDRSVFSKFGSKVKKWMESFEQRFRGHVNPMAFLYDFIFYLSLRLRVMTVLIAVFFEVLGAYFESVKNIFVKNLFWGRGSIFRFSIQFVAAVVTVIIVVSYPYRLNPITSNILSGSDAVVLAQQDLLTQGRSVATPIPEDRKSYDSTTYVVKTGDTLSRIAEINQIGVETIMWANDLTAASFIRPGDKLTIPPGDGVLVETKKGDTVEKLAKTYNSSPQLILEANIEQLLPPDYLIRAGSSLFIPDGRPPAPVRPTTPVYSGTIVTRPYTPIYSSPIVPGVGRFLNWPVSRGGQVSQCYSRWHNGIDIADRSYPNLVAAAPGRVTFAGCQSGSCPRLGSLIGGYGLAWTVIIDHGNGLSTVYGHMHSIYVRNGQYIGAGQALGQMGQTGTAYGVHVHFMVIRSNGGWSSLNPAPYFKTHLCGY